MALSPDEWKVVAEHLCVADGGSWHGVLRGVCRASCVGVQRAREVDAAKGSGRRRMDPRVFTSRVELLRWAVEQGCALMDDERVVRAAVVDGGLGVLQWGVQSRGWDLPKQHHKTTCWAAEAGQLEVLQWAREQGCPWDDATCLEAARSGNLSVLQWARTQGCPWDAYRCLWEAYVMWHVDVVGWMLDHVPHHWI
mmetsp:Transcript_10942/g.27521  ORF Transcript_10942/g.27521 Transcript_10942/m.27521 type:complete len:195 (-) Transcript_10942:501-1085(-)